MLFSAVFVDAPEQTEQTELTERRVKLLPAQALVVVHVVVLEQVEQRALKHVLGETLLFNDLTGRRDIDGQLQKV